MQKPESILKNETHKILCDFEILTDSRQKLRLCFDWQEKKKNLGYRGFWRSSGSQRENKIKWKDKQMLWSYQRTNPPPKKKQKNKQTVEHEDDGDTNSSWCTWKKD